MNNAALRKLMNGLTISVSPFIMISQPVLAQASNSAAADAPTKDVIQDIIVTARKRDESVQRVPMSITAASGDQLKQQSISTLSNLQTLAPGLYVQAAVGDGQSVILTMRGRKQEDATLAVDSAVGLVADGLYVPRTIGMAGAMLDINRVEVLRGPQGTLYGRNTTSGAIGIITNDPKHELSASVDTTVGNYDTWNVLGILNFPIADNLDARIVAQKGGHAGYATTSTGTPLDDAKNEYYRGKLRWSGANNWEAVLSGQFENDVSGSSRGFIPGLNPADFQGNGLPEGSYLTLETEAELGVSEAQAVALLKSWTAQRSPWYTLNNTNGPALRSTLKKWSVGLNIKGDVTDNVQLHSISGVQYFSRALLGGPQSAIFLYKGDTTSKETYYSQELQLLGSAPTLKWVAGVYGGLESGSEGQTIFFLPAVFGTGATAHDAKILYTNLAVFAQATWEFLPDWHLTAGGRYSADRRRVDANAFNVDYVDPSVHDCVVPAPGVAVADPSDPATVQCPRRFKANFSKPTWLVSLDHQLARGVLVYAKVATGYRSGGLNADQGSTEQETFAAFAPETNIEYEAGVKMDLFERRVRLNIDGFLDNYSNLQEKTTTIGSDGSLLTIVTSASKSRAKGAEAEGDVVVADGLRLHGSLSYTDARYLKFVDSLGDHSNRPFAIPKWTVNVSGNYTRPTRIGEASLQVDYAWKSSVDVVTPSSLASEVTQHAYGLLNARANVHVNAWDVDVAVFGQNLADKRYFDQGFNVSVPGFDYNNLYEGAAPRTFGVEIVKKFG